MKFLLTTYSTAFIASGGGESEMIQVAQTLLENGHLADIYGPQSRPINFYDAVMHFSVEINGWPIYQRLAVEKKNLFLWPNVWWTEKPGDEEVSIINLFVEKAKNIFFKSMAERDNFIKYIKFPIEKAVVIPICVSREFLASPNILLAKTMVEYEDYVICLGRIEPVKNQLNLIQAINKLNLKAVMVGGSNNNPYMEQCKNAAKGNVAFLPFVQPRSNLLVSLLSAAKVMAEPCFDPVGRSGLEASILGVPMVLSQNHLNAECFKNNFYGVDPNSVDSIACGIEQAWLDEKKFSTYAREFVELNNASEDAIEKFIEKIVDSCE